MCGILGTNQSILKDKFDNTLKKLSHRGPDNLSSRKINDFLLGHTRLSIIDLDKKSNQPMTIDNYTIVFNGEIYNYKELSKKYGLKCTTQSDTEVLLRCFILKQSDILKELDGMFSFAIYNNIDKKLFLARDNMGEKPLYYYKKDNIFIFSSSIDTIVDMVYNITINKQAIWDFLTFSWIPEPDTIYNEIKTLPKSSYGIYDGQRFYIQEYKFDYEIKNRNLISETYDLVIDSVNKRLISDVKVGAFLSGGLDSSIVSIIAAKKNKNIDLFSIGFEDNFCPYNGFSDETEYAKSVANIINFANHHIIRVSQKDFDNLLDDYIQAIDQPFAISSGLGILQISSYAKNIGVKVLLSGDGADECFGGYSHYPLLQYNNLSYFSKDKPKGWHWRFTDSEKDKLLNKELFNKTKTSTRLLIQDYLNKNPKDFIDHDKNFYLYNEMMTKLDRMTMFHSIEGRAIFTSPKILKMTDDLSYDDLLKNGQKWILKEAFNKDLPDIIKKRKKHGFNVPMNVWFKDKWKNKLKNLFDKNSSLNKMGILSISFEEYLDKYIDDKRFGELSFNLLVLELWLTNKSKGSIK